MCPFKDADEIRRRLQEVTKHFNAKDKHNDFFKTLYTLDCKLFQANNDVSDGREGKLVLNLFSTWQ